MSRPDDVDGDEQPTEGSGGTPPSLPVPPGMPGPLVRPSPTAWSPPPLEPPPATPVPTRPADGAPGATASLATRAVLVLAVLAAVGGLVVDGAVDRAPGPVALAGEGRPEAGSTTCAALSLEGGGETVVGAVLDPATAALAGESSGDAEQEATVSVLDGDTSEVVSTLSPAAARSSATLSPGEQEVVTARWEQVPLLLARRLVPPEGARVAGSVEGPCAAGVADRWWVPGVVTAGGASATLHLANPTGAPASLEIVFTTPDERIEPTRLGNVVVPAGERRVVDLNEFAPERPDLGVEVVARTGQVVVEVVQQLEAAIGGIDGRSLVPATTVPAGEWTVPWVDGGDDSSAWLWVTNPGDRSTEVRIVVHGPDGPSVPEGAGSTIGPGRTQRIDLRGALDGGARAVTVRSDEAPVVVAGAVVRTGLPTAVDGDGVLFGSEAATDADPLDVIGETAEDDVAARGGIAVVGAVEAQRGRAAVVVDAADPRPRTLVVANPAEEPATATVAVLDGTGTTRLDRLTIAPGAVATVPVVLGVDQGVVALVVDATDGRVASALVSATTAGPLELTAATLRPFVDGTVVVLDEVLFDRSLLHPIELGPTDPAAPSDGSAVTQDPDEG